MIDTSFLPKAIEGHMQEQPEVTAMWQDIKVQTNFNSLLEIGFNVGHSAVYVMSLFPDTIVDSVDINRDPRTQEGADLVKARYSSRFNFYTYNTLQLKEDIDNGSFKFQNTYDLVFVDGGHEYSVAVNDIQMAKDLGVKYIVVDDTNMDDVKRAVADSTNLEEVAVYNYVWRKSKKKQNQVEAKLYKVIP